MKKKCEDLRTTSFGMPLLCDTVRGSLNPSLVSTAPEELGMEESSPDWEVLKAPRSPAATRVMSAGHFPDGISVRLPGDFHEHYLDAGLWPDLDAEREDRLLQKLAQLKVENSELRLYTESLRRNLRRTPVCDQCDIERDKHEKTKQALSQALDLSKVLLKEVRRLDSGLRTKDGG